MISFTPTAWVGLETVGAEELNALRPRAELAVVRAGRYFVNAVKKTLSGPRSGRIYRGRRGRLHQASAPGEPPATQTGKLRQSITMSEPEWVGWNVSVDIGSNQPQARRLEYGGVDRRGVRILPRPYFEPTAIRVQAQVEVILESSI